MNPHIANKLCIDLKPNPDLFNVPVVPVYTAAGDPIQSFSERSMPPITINTVIRGTRNRIDFQNVGKTDWRVGNWTIKANGGVKSIGSSNDVNVQIQDLVVCCDSDPFNTNGDNRLEWSEFILDDTAVVNFKF